MYDPLCMQNAPGALFPPLEQCIALPFCYAVLVRLHFVLMLAHACMRAHTHTNSCRIAVKRIAAAFVCKQMRCLYLRQHKYW